jgi:hypothetical protein
MPAASILTVFEPCSRSFVRSRSLGLVAAAACFLTVGGCRSTAVVERPPLTDVQLEQAREALGRPLANNLAALYKLRVPRSSGLKASIRTVGDQGRLGITGPFGDVVSLAAWQAGEMGEMFDLKEGCRIPRVNLDAVLGAGRLPLAQAILLLAGRLPAMAGDRVSITPDGELEVVGLDWSARVAVAADPWRVVEVRAVTRGEPAWRISLSDHDGHVPTEIRIDRSDGDWARLKLVRLVFTVGGALPPLPDLEVCEPEGSSS